MIIMDTFMSVSLRRQCAKSSNDLAAGLEKLEKSTLNHNTPSTNRTKADRKKHITKQCNLKNKSLVPERKDEHVKRNLYETFADTSSKTEKVERIPKKMRKYNSESVFRTKNGDTIIFGQTPTSVRKSDFLKIAASQGLSVKDFAKQVSQMTAAERNEVLHDYYGKIAQGDDQSEIVDSVYGIDSSQDKPSTSVQSSFQLSQSHICTANVQSELISNELQAESDPNESHQNTNESMRAGHESPRNANESSQNTNKSIRERSGSPENANELLPNSNESSENVNESAQNANESSENANELLPNSNESSQIANEAVGVSIESERSEQNQQKISRSPKNLSAAEAFLSDLFF